MDPRHGLLHPRDQIMHTMERIYHYRMTTTSGGNLSIREENGDIWITPARIDKGSLRREDIVCVHPDGSVEGRHRPSSELPFHRAIYTARPEMRGIVHAHPVALVAFSICRKVPDTRVLYQSRRVCSEVGFAPYALPGSEILGNNIARTFAAGHDCVVLENHGVVVGGDDLQHAFERFETLEFAAKTIIKASMLGEVHYLGEDDLRRPSLPGPPRSGNTTVPASARERELRRELCDFVRRAYQQRLMISTQGAFSARLDGDAFLITPRGVDRQSLELIDIVLVRNGIPESGKVPSRAWINHHAVYVAQPSVQAIVNAYPVNATAFSVTSADLDTRTIPESYLFLREIQRPAPGEQFQDGKSLAAQSTMRTPIALLANDGVQVCGQSVLDAFDRLEVLESTAEAMINSRPLGAMVPMPSQAIDELIATFLKEQ